jgi:anti-anti-sigma regulatory factor
LDQVRQGSDVLFILLGAVMVLAMHAGFAFLELGTVRTKNQVNALVKILADFSVSTVAYFFVGYTIAYGVQFFGGAEQLAQQGGYALVKFFFLLTFAAAIPAIVSGGIAERARFGPQVAATFAIVALVYPTFEGIAWNGHFGVQAWLARTFGAEFHDFAGSVVVHAVGGWIALVAVLLLGILQGVLLASIASIFLLLARASRPNVAFLGRLPGSGRYSDRARHDGVERLAGVVAFRPEASLLYINAETILDTVLMALRRSPETRLVACDLSASPSIDLAGARMLRDLHDELASRRVAFCIVGAHAQLRDLLRAEGLAEKTDSDQWLRSLDSVLEERQAEVMRAT